MIQDESSISPTEREKLILRGKRNEEIGIKQGVTKN